MSLLATVARPPDVEDWHRPCWPEENDGVELLPRRLTAYSVPPSCQTFGPGKNSPKLPFVLKLVLRSVGLPRAS
jgi:hypothetical protein